MKKSIEDLKALKPTVLMPGHCTGWRFKGLIEKEMPGQMAPVFGGTKYHL
jgi:7,8-dihydropterin-6-yl-methyl-4-(beta-D-ribofuranosyl)aminobenzene 5'-phosphate synthase